jgi:uncharacterized membrane protein YsdA (DUF1294 family)
MKRYFIIPLILAVLLTATLINLISFLDILVSWIISMTLLTFLTYGYDKAIADSGRSRVPEWVLLGLAFFGGTLGALAGMFVFKHKTAKRSFQAKLLVVLAVQAGLIFAYYWFLLR